MSITDQPSERNPLVIEAEADDLEAQAFRLRAIAKRRRAELEIESVHTRHAVANQTAEHMTRAEYASRSNISTATVGRLIVEGMPSIPVGSTVRIDPVVADKWRRERGRRPTKAAVPAASVDVDGALALAGLRVIRGQR